MSAELICDTLQVPAATPTNTPALARDPRRQVSAWNSVLLILGLAPMLLATGCGASSSLPGNAPGAHSNALTIDPPSPVITTGQTVHLIASTPGSGNVNWTVLPSTAGKVDSAGNFTASATPGTATITALGKGSQAAYKATTDLTIVSGPVASITTSASTMTVRTNLTASIPNQTGAQYLWAINGGALISGQHTSQIQFTSLSPGSVKIACAVKNAAGVAAIGNAYVTVVDLPPAVAYAPQSRTVTLGMPAVPMLPVSTGGAVLAWTIKPGLPSGLTFDRTSGQIAGLPNALAAAAMYTVTASNSGGTGSALLKLAAVDLPPVIQYASLTKTFTRGSAVAPMLASNSGGTALTWAISHPLPAGLAFNTTSGAITGTPTEATSGVSTYLVTASNSGGTSNAVTLTLSVADSSAATSGTTYFVSNQGNDSQAGTSAATAWKTVAKVASMNFQPCDAILFQRGGVWNEELIEPSSGSAGCPIRFGNYGSANLDLPILDGADRVTGWTQQSGSTYMAPYTAPARKAYVDNVTAETVALALQASIADVNSTPGSVFSDGHYVYVHLLDGSNPVSHAIEVSGSRHFIFYGLGKKYVTVDGLKLIRATYTNLAWQAGGSNASVDTGGNYLTIQNSQIFNCGGTEGVNQSDFILFNEGCVIVQGWNEASQQGLQGIVIQNNYIGLFDFAGPPVTDASRSGLKLQGVVGARITNNIVKTGPQTAIFVTNFFSNLNNSDNYLAYNDISGSNENIVLASCNNCTVDHNQIHDGHGTGIEVGSTGAPGSTSSLGTLVTYNEIWNLAPTYDLVGYNGIDCNGGASGGTAIGNHIWAVSSASMTLEADGGACSGWLVAGNTFDATHNLNYLGETPSGSAPAYTIYYRDESLAGLNFWNNVQVVNPPGSVVKYGATSAGDSTHDFTLEQFLALTGAMNSIPPTAPTGGCPVAGVWVFSADGHGTVCNAGTWQTKI